MKAQNSKTNQERAKTNQMNLPKLFQELQNHMENNKFLSEKDISIKEQRKFKKTINVYV